MHQIVELAFSLSANENLKIDVYYKMQQKGKAGRRLELLNLVRSGKVKTDKEGANLLYGTKPSSALYNLKKGLKDDLYNIILISTEIAESEMTYSEAAFYCRKKLTLGEILWERGAYNASVAVLTQATFIAKKYELTAEYMSCLDILRTSIGFKKGIKIYNKYTEEIENVFELHKDILRAKAYSKQVGLAGTFKKNQDNEFEAFAMDRKNDLEQLYKKYRSPNVGYWYLRTSVYYFQITKEFKEALKCAKRMLVLVEKEEAIRSQKNLAFGNSLIANILMEIGEFKDALKYASTAILLYEKKQVNYLVALEMLFVAAVYCDKVSVAQKSINTGMRHWQLKGNPFINAKWNYYKANLAFLKKDYHQVIKILRVTNQLTKDTSGWLIGYKLLEILTLIELNETEIAALRIRAFKKLLKRIKNHPTVRYELIAELLDELVKSDFTFEDVIKGNKRKLTLLQTAKGEYYWDPVAFEIIRFDHWLLGKL